MLEFEVHNQTISRHDDMGVVADSINYLIAHFDLTDSEFGGVTTAIFTPMFTGISYEQILENDSCVVPWEVIKSRGFKVSLYCNKGDVRITTNEISIPVKESGFAKGDTPSEPSKTVYEQLISDVSKAVDTATSVKEQADNGEFNGKDAVTDIDFNINSSNAIANSAVTQKFETVSDRLNSILKAFENGNCRGFRIFNSQADREEMWSELKNEKEFFIALTTETKAEGTDGWYQGITLVKKGETIDLTHSETLFQLVPLLSLLVEKGGLINVTSSEEFAKYLYDDSGIVHYPCVLRIDFDFQSSTLSEFNIATHSTGFNWNNVEQGDYIVYFDNSNIELIKNPDNHLNSVTDYWKLENSPFKPVPDAPNPPDLLRVPQDLEAGAYIFTKDKHILFNGSSLYPSKGNLLYISGSSAVMLNSSGMIISNQNSDGYNTVGLDTFSGIEEIYQALRMIGGWIAPLFNAKSGQLVSVKSADLDNETLELECVDYPNLISTENIEIKQLTDTEVCITDNANRGIKSIICDSYPKQITVVKNNMATCDDFFRDMTNKQGKLVFTNHLDTKYNQGGVTYVYLDGLKKGSYVMSAKSNTVGQTVNKMVRTSAGAAIANTSSLDEYVFTNQQDRAGQIQVRFEPTAVGITATQVYMCKAEDKQVITVNSAKDVFDNILGDENTYLFAEDGSEITVCYETEKKDKPLQGKYLSVLGDSISSYEGYAKNADHIIYPNFDVFKPNRIYWGRFCEITGATPLVIDGVGSSLVTNVRDNLNGDETFLGMYHDNRAKYLGKDGIVPDIIVIEGGTNDMALNVTLGTYDGSTDFPTTANNFREAYAIMLDKIRTEYPKAEIYCCTIMARPNATDYKIKQYNDAIRETAELMGAKIIDFAKCLNSKNYQHFISSDNIHPEYDGHIRMCDEMIKAVL